jgi:23S rRNA (cytidine2498-2'-O)-methyltransferase
LAWAFLCRSGWERDLCVEVDGEIIGEGVVLARDRPRGEDGHLTEPAFARQAMRTEADVCDYAVEPLADRIAASIRPKIGRWSLQIVAPDGRDPRDARRRWVDASAAALTEAILARLPPPVRGSMAERDLDHLVQVWPVDETGVLIGVTPTRLALSSAPGGRVRLRREEDSPSRAGLKLEEAIQWIGVGPERGESVADLGAAPGGWSQVAVHRGAHVVAIDPAKIKVDLPRNRFRHEQRSAFDFAPEETLDWVLCDMAWRPLEVGKLLAKWGRRGWARQMIANIKLPMKKRAEMLAEIRAMLEGAGWKGVRARQLAHDRDEVTLFAWLDPHIAARGARAPFEMGSKRRREERARPKGQRKSKRKTSIKRR